MANRSQEQYTKHQSNSAKLMVATVFLPFIGCAITLLVLGKDNPLFEPLVDMFKTWSAIILAFLGGIRWGSALYSVPESLSRMSAATLLPVAGWLALFISGPIGILVLLLVYCAQGAWDSFSGTMADAPKWYSKIRITFILVAAASHIIVFVAVY
ncbi:MAG: DUF3429 domain-containing protein [Rhizobiaceae bacterium]|nr:DUF3429 domain-containing protein [Rhizobiaceae bacterium]